MLTASPVVMQGGAQLRGDVELEEGMSDDDGDEESDEGMYLFHSSMISQKSF